MKIKLIFLFVLIFGFQLFSKEEVLIDFNNLSGTEIDFSEFADAMTITPEEKAAMKLDLGIKNWTVKINPSSLNFLSRTKAMAVPVKNSIRFPNETLLGVRIYFPAHDFNAYAEIRPPFDIPSFYEDPAKPTGMGEMFLNKGVVRNVAVIKKISIQVLGNNYNYNITVRLKKDNDEIQDVFLGYLNFLGWKTLTWVNSDAEEQSRKKINKKDITPYYPSEYPFVKLDSIIIQRQGTEVSGNFVTMIKDIVVTYDEYMYESTRTETFSMQEGNFNIYKEDLLEKSRHEIRNVNKRLLELWRETQKINKNK